MTNADSIAISEAIKEAHDFININKGFFYNSICDELPHSHLLRHNAIFNMLKTQNKVTLAHQTTNISKIKQSGSIHTSFGCLGQAVYTIPMYIDSDTNMHYNDNFFDLVLSHQDEKLLGKLGVVFIETRNTALKNDLLLGINYLRLGKFIELLSKRIVFQKSTKDKIESKVSELVLSIEMRTIKNPESSAEEVLDSLSKLGNRSSFFALLYYEALSQVIMLSSEEKKQLN